MVARAKAEGDTDGVKRYVERGARLAMIASGLMVSVIVALPSQLLAFAYSREVAERGAATLRVLALGQGAYAVLAIATTVLASLGWELLSATLMAGTLLAVVSGVALLAMPAAFGASQLEGAALGTSLALLLALLAAGFAVRRLAGAFVPMRTAARVLLAIGVVGLVGRYLPTGGGRILTIGLAMVVAAAFAILLVVTRELTGVDAAALSSLRKAQGDDKTTTT
jgi:stage V sporulation protein B